MNPEDHLERARWMDLFSGMLAGTLEAGDMERLERILGESADARRAWFLFADMDAGLAEWAAGRASTEDACGVEKTGGWGGGTVAAREISMESARAGTTASKVGAKTAPWRFRILAAAAVLALLGTVLGILPRQDAASSPVLARVEMAVDAVWGDAARPSGAVISTEKISLESGAVHLRTETGVDVVIEGPAGFQMLAADTLALFSGRLRANIPPGGSGGLRVEGMGFTVVDLGTEFGCLATTDGQAEIHTFQGSVRVQPMGRSQRDVYASRAVALENGILQEIPARPEKFLSREGIRRRADSPNGRRSEAAAIVRSHPKLIAYLGACHGADGKIEAVDGRGFRLPVDEMGGLACRAGAPDERTGIWFDGVGAALRLEASARTDKLTLLAWVRVENSGKRQFLATGAGPSLPNEVAWVLSEKGRLRAGVLVPVADGAARGWQSRDSRDAALNDAGWNLLATVIDCGSRMIRHYGNGREIGAGPARLPKELVLGSLWIGGAGHEPEHQRVTAPFRGGISEMAWIGDALPEDELRRIYELGKDGENAVVTPPAQRRGHENPAKSR